MSVEVRRAVAADLPALLHLYEQLADGLGSGPDAPPVSPAEAEAAFANLLSQPHRTLLTATLDGAVAATADLIVVTPNLTHEGRPWAIVEHVVVEHRARGRGVGRGLMEDVTRRAREAGCYKLQLLSSRRRTQAHAFYQALGFEASAQGFRIYLD